MIKLLTPPDSNRFIDGKSVFRLYIAMKYHFGGKFDIVKYDWVVGKVSDKAYQKRKDRLFFERLSNKYKFKELYLLLLSNLIANQEAWIGELSDSDAIDFYKQYVVKFKSLEETIKEDLGNIFYFSKKMKISLNEVISFNEKTNTSYLFKLLQSQIITPEVFLFLDSFLDIINKYDSLMPNIIWSSYSIRLNAYKKLLIIDKNLAKTKFKEIIENLKN